MGTTKTKLGEISGIPIYQVELQNSHGMKACFLNLGAILKSLFVHDRSGNLIDVVLGFDQYESYLKNSAYIGAVCGRFANRIKKGHFELNGKEYQLAINNGSNALHGGIKGFNQKIYQIQEESFDPTLSKIVFNAHSPNGEEGYPGDLEWTVSYQLTEQNELKIIYTAESSEDTILNLTNHAYFNLNGAGSGDIFKHELKLYSTHYLELDEECCPTGKIHATKETPFDFKEYKPLGQQMFSEFPQIKSGRGYDTNFCYEKQNGIKKVADLKSLQSGCHLTVFTTAPGIQIYTGNWLGEIHGKDGSLYNDYSGVALETQNWPAAPNFSHFPSAVLKKGTIFKSETIYSFSIDI